MKRFIIVLTALAVLGVTVSAQTLDDFKNAFQTFADDMAGVLAVNSTTGNIWSSAYVGSFPKFGVGLAVGANLIPVDSVSTFADAAGFALPSELEENGMPIPGVAASFKIGVPFLRMDIGVKGGLLPDFASGALSGMGVEATYETLGFNVRYALLKDRLFVPAVSLGASWNYVKGSARTSLGSSSSYDYTISGTSYDDTYTILFSSPDLDLNWDAHIFDFTLQVSKNLLIFTPYAGAGLTIGKATVHGGMSASTTVTDSGGLTPSSDAMDALESYAASQGISLDDQGFLVSSESNNPTFRIYGGTSINIFILKIDLMANYVPTTKALGAQVMARIQF